MGKKKNDQPVNLVPDLKLIFAPKNDEQKLLLKTIADSTITFVRGCAGTGKTWVSVAYALQRLFQKRCQKIVLARPIVEAGGEKLGHLPGEVADKVKNYFTPAMTIISQLLDHDTFKYLTNGNGEGAKIQIIPLAFMRGLTLSDATVIFDEAQNSTVDQMRLLLSRIGENSKFIICGDTNQSDIREMNGLEDAFNLLYGIENIGFVTLTEESIVRHPIIRDIEQRYQKRQELLRTKKFKTGT